ncbi:MAG TPA: hypothetical protein ENG87_02310 [Candidatus Pacearchaeota archaeon]|nr:hypothetical protein BMS3Abin17_00363 [archaeon BMS3Abin17]HDK42188.1 hypothetical protein [Candidatus Pacearchaeota archaeon]HDZ60229.1 hypothetical protein [Candidatus Pacearchaeota archaeon]
MKKEKAQLMFKLAYSKKNWGAKYDQLEHFKRFSDLKGIVKELENIGWLIVKKKANYTGISLNPKFKKEIIEFIEEQIPTVKGWIM